MEFAPRHLGLRIASGSADGTVRVYEALDTMNLNHWKLEAEIEENADGEAGGGRDRGGRGRVVGNNSNNIDNDNNNGDASSNENMGVSSLSWCTGRFEPATLAVGYSSGRVSIYRYEDGRDGRSRAWLEAMRLPGHATSSGGSPAACWTSGGPPTSVGRST